MAQRHHFRLLFIVCVFLFSCKEKTPEPNAQSADAQTVPGGHGPVPVNHDSLLAVLRPREAAVLADPTSNAPLQALYTAANDSMHNLFYLIGKGVPNPKLPASVQNQSMQRASRISGERWALYFKALQTGTAVSLSTPLTGNLVAGSTLLCEITSNDTLYQLFSIPSDSIILIQ
jgi:hypothetical protein